eukprot:m.477873 g.477873  ORF g.477873 m.477873 type:complete len:109 (-) comp57163_c0_seq31:4105-4431(-)
MTNDSTIDCTFKCPSVALFPAAYPLWLCASFYVAILFWCAALLVRNRSGGWTFRVFRHACFVLFFCQVRENQLLSCPVPRYVFLNFACTGSIPSSVSSSCSRSYARWC